jgi:hypothetical protein
MRLARKGADRKPETGMVVDSFVAHQTLWALRIHDRSEVLVREAFQTGRIGFPARCQSVFFPELTGAARIHAAPFFCLDEKTRSLL